MISRQWRSIVWGTILIFMTSSSTKSVYRCAGAFVLPSPLRSIGLAVSRSKVHKMHQRYGYGIFGPSKVCLQRLPSQESFTRMAPEQQTNNDIDRTIAVQKAEALRRRARELTAEAEAAESKLRNDTLSRKNQMDAELDVIIDDLVATIAAAGGINQTAEITIGGIERTGGTNGMIGGDAIAKKLRSIEIERSGTNVMIEGRGDAALDNQKRVDAIAAKLRSSDHAMTTTRLLRIVERIHERERLASSAVDWMENAMMGETKRNYNEDDVQKIAQGTGLGGLAHCLIEAVTLLEEERNGGMDTKVESIDNSEDMSAKVVGGESLQTKSDKKSRRSYDIATETAPKLRSRLKELRRADEEKLKRNFATLSLRTIAMLRRGSNGTKIVTQSQNTSRLEAAIMRNVRSKSNATKKMVENILDGVPAWLPNSIIPFVLLNDEQLDKSDLQKLRDEVLTGSQFYCTGWESLRYAAMFRGNFVQKSKAVARLGNEANESQIDKEFEHDRISRDTFANVQERLASSDLSARIQLFLLQDPEDRKVQDESEARSVIVAIPASVRPTKSTDCNAGTKILLVLATLLTAMSYAMSVYALNTGGFLDALVKGKGLPVLAQCMPFFGGLFALLGVYEVARYVMANRNGISLGLPVPLPSLHFGTLGCKTPILSFPKTRKNVMDVALIGPATTMFLSLLSIYVGLHMTINAPPHALARMPAVPAGVVSKSSLLVSLLVMKVCPKLLMLPLSQPVPIHPLSLVGMTGLVLSALNVLPIGRLDGGRAFLAAFGRSNANLASFLTLLILLTSAFAGSTTVSIFCAFLILNFQRKAEVPVRNEVTGVGRLRLWLLTFFLTAAGTILAPFPGGLGGFC